MPPSIFTLSAAEKERKIANVAHLIPEYYDDGSIVNEPGIVAKISKLLKPNQWLRVERPEYEKYDYSKSIEYNKQHKAFMKPNGIWASKGEWSFRPEAELTLLEVDYSRILVLTTKEDYIEFEDRYCRKLPKKIRIVKRRTRLSKRWNGGARTITKKNTSNSSTTSKSSKSGKSDGKMVCTMYINWQAVAKDYDGIAMVPFGRPYFNRREMGDYKNHLWLATYDVSSLVIWRHDGQTPITNAVNLGKTGGLYRPKSSEQEERVLDDKKVIQVLKAGIKEMEKK